MDYVIVSSNASIGLVVLSKLLYASSSWIGFTDATLQIDKRCNPSLIRARAGLRPNWAWCCCPEKGLLFSWHSGPTKKSLSRSPGP